MLTIKVKNVLRLTQAISDIQKCSYNQESAEKLRQIQRDMPQKIQKDSVSEHSTLLQQGENCLKNDNRGKSKLYN